MNHWHNTSTLVIGGAGFCGAHLCEELLQRNARVTVLDQAIQPGGYFARAGLLSKTRFLNGDILNLEFLKNLFEAENFDTIFHLAAQPIVSVSNASPLQTAHVNIIGTYNVLEAIRLSSHNPKLVFASSGAYYGATQTSAPIPEDSSALVAGNIYAPTKAAADLAVRCYAKIYGLRAATCRWMNTYGAGDTNFTRIVPATIRRLQNGERAQIDGTDGSNVLEVLHISDMIAAYFSVAENLDDENVRGEAFNFGGGTPITLHELVIEITHAWNFMSGENVNKEPTITGPCVDSVKYLDISKARRVLGWQPRVELQDGLRETVKWYRDNYQSQ